MARLILVLDNLRSCHNVGSIIRTANGFKQQRFIFIGSTPYPAIARDQRLPWAVEKQTRLIAKTALGAEQEIEGEHFEDAADFLRVREKIELVCLEQTDRGQKLADYLWPTSAYLVFGNELAGVSPAILTVAETHLQIPMLGNKESFNVAVAAGIALYQHHLKAN